MAAARTLEPAHDRALFAFDNAPLADEPETAEERAAVEEARADGRSRVIDRSEMRSILERGAPHLFLDREALIERPVSSS